MSVTIERAKGGRTHFAVSVAAQLATDANGGAAVTGNGNVTEWTEDKSRAGQFPGGVAKKCAEYYRDRKNAGAIVFKDGNKVLCEVGAETEGEFSLGPTTYQTDVEELRAERDEFQRQARVLGDEVTALRAENADLRKKFKEAEDLIAAAK